MVSSETPNQIEVTNRIRDIAFTLGGEDSFVENAVNYILTQIERKSYNPATSAHEKSIRWTRSADQILSDGYMYDTKWCTDGAVVFCALCEARAYPNGFLKVKDDKTEMHHAMSEVLIGGEWQTVEVTKKGLVYPGRFNIGDIIGERWRVDKKGKSSWDIGLTNFAEQGYDDEKPINDHWPKRLLKRFKIFHKY